MQLKWVAQHLIEDTYYGKLEPMMLRSGMSSRDRLLTDIKVHVAVSVQQATDSICSNDDNALTVLFYFKRYNSSTPSTLPLHFGNKFPKTISVELSRSINTWKNIVMYLEKKHEQEIY